MIDEVGVVRISLAPVFRRGIGRPMPAARVTMLKHGVNGD